MLKEKLDIFTILSHRDWRVHEHRLYQYVNGAWMKKDVLKLDDYDPLTCAEGILIELADI